MNSSPENLIARYLSCPRCRLGNLDTNSVGYLCIACGHRGEIREGVFLTSVLDSNRYFDNLHRVMQMGNDEVSVQTMCYSQQSETASGLIKPGDVVLDVGCGPVVHFKRPEDCILIGIDPSFESIRVNRSLDVRIGGSAEALPFRDHSVDRIFFFYSIHHMIGSTVEENKRNLAAALREAGRVVRAHGQIVVFDVNPWWLAWQAQKMAWNQARGLFSDRLDMYFWRDSVLRRLAREAFSERSFEAKTFKVSPFLVFPPVFSLPRLKVPRFLYPFDIMMYKWSF